LPEKKQKEDLGMALQKAITRCGTAVGVPGSDPAITVFRGVPFAQPPVGSLRFAEPQPPLPWQGERVFDTWPRPCVPYQRPRRQGSAPEPSSAPAGSEDCLYLNLWTAAQTAAEKRPVMVWFFGGGFANGWCASPEFRGEALVKKGVVLVTVNYRCGPLGFAAHPFLSARSASGTSGNYGLLDQAAALRWVRDNIGAFGGDAARVTIFGQSAGGMSCKYHLCSPLSRGLFRRAILQSGGGLIAADPTRPRRALEEITQRCLDLLGWQPEELLTRPAAELTKALGDAADPATGGKELFVFQPCVDGRMLTELPEKTIADGTYDLTADVICGTVSGDSWMFSRKVRAALGENEPALRAFAYAPGVVWGRHQVHTGRPPIRTYFMERDQGGGRTPHGSEIPYVFGTLAARPGPDTPFDREISADLTAYWANFAAAGDPNGPGLPAWPLFTAQQPFALHITDDAIRAEALADGPEAERVLAFTEAHPGMPESLEGF
jgi:para-nitrobenzyl esterase